MTLSSNRVRRLPEGALPQAARLALEPLTAADGGAEAALAGGKTAALRQDVRADGASPPGEAEAAAASLREEEENARRERERLLSQAREEAARLLRTAGEEAQALREQAAKEGYDEGHKRGLSEGEARAREEAAAGEKERHRRFESELRQAVEAVGRAKEDCIRQYLDELRDVAVAVGEKVIRVSLKSNGDIIRRMIEAETEKHKKTEWVRIYLERGEYETMVKADAELLPHLARLSDNIKFVVMEQENGGSCIIETPEEIVDLSVDTQMDNIRRLVDSA